MTGFRKLFELLKESKTQNFLFVVFLSFAVIFSVFVYILFSDVDMYRKHPRMIVSALYLDVACVLCVILLGVNQLMRLFSKRQRGSSMLTLKLISIFSVLSVVPSAMMCIFSAIFFHNGLDSWFNERNQVVLKESINIANSYLEEHKKKAIHDCSVITKSIEYYIDNIDKFPGNKRQQFVEIGHILDEICRIREVNAAIVMDSILRVVAHSRYSTALHFLNFYYSEVQNLKKAPHRTKIIETADNDTIAAMSYFSAHGENMYLLIEKKVDPHIFIYAQHAQRSYQDYLQMYHERGSLEIAFVFIFLIVGILMLVSSISIAVVFSWRIVNPVSNLIDVAEKIINGNLSARVQGSKTYKEIQLLSSTFNHMVETMQTQQKDLIKVNQELDEKVKFATSVLAGVSSGVIGTDNGYVYVWNSAAEELLGRNIIFGEHIADILPDVEEMLSQNSDTILKKDIQYKKGNQVSVFSLKVAHILLKNEHRAVVTFTDLTDVLVAQRKAAWTEVARRVAHEIKNPLTPIQLSAERIRRKYLRQIVDDPDTFSALTDVIVKQVGDIKRLLDEFNFFARLPEPKLMACNLYEICSQAIFLMQNVADNVTIHFDDADRGCKINADERLLHQSIVNLIQNAINALSTVQKSDKGIWVSLSRKEGKAILQIEDNGPGLPKEKMESLATPYFTLMPKGTGLGLAIVKKIICDHNGELRFGESEHGGAKVTLSIPIEVA